MALKSSVTSFPQKGLGLSARHHQKGIGVVAAFASARLRAVRSVAHSVLGDRRYAICREMTKAHEQIFRSRLPYVPAESEVPRKGEFTIVIEGRRRAEH